MDISNSIESAAYQSYLNRSNEAWRRMPKGLDLSFVTDKKKSRETISDILKTKSGDIHTRPKRLTLNEQAWKNTQNWHDEFLFDAMFDVQPQTILCTLPEVIWKDEIESSRVACYQLVIPKGSEVWLQEHAMFKSGMRRLDIVVEDGAVLHHSICLDAIERSYDHVDVTVMSEGIYHQCFAMQCQSDYRRALRVRLFDHAQAILEGCVIGSGQSKVVDNVTFLHEGERSKSQHTLNSIVLSDSSMDSHSLVDIASTGAFASSRQYIEHLLLSESAKAFSQPSLKVRYDDVDCQHGAVTKVLDDLLLFYMSSRGLDDSVAKRMYVEGVIQQSVSNMPKWQKVRTQHLITALRNWDE